MLVGGNGPGAEERVLRYGDGWMPQCGPLASVDELATRITSLRRRAADQGRGPVPVTLFGVPYRRDLVDQLAEAGVDRCLFPVAGDDPGEVLSLLDQAAALR